MVVVFDHSGILFQRKSLDANYTALIWLSLYLRLDHQSFTNPKLNVLSDVKVTISNYHAVKLCLNSGNLKWISHLGIRTWSSLGK